MKLKRLEIQSLAGIEQAFSIDFEPAAVNVITGPNASGKSSLVRAVRALLYPDLDQNFCQLHATWLDQDQELSCERQGSSVSWLRDGKPVARPRLPGHESLGAFLISAEDLNALGSTDQHISGQLRMMLAGGYDLEAVLARRPLISRPRPQKLARELTTLSARLADKEGEYAALRDELSDLERLNRELAATTDAATRLRACEDALALAEAIARRSAIELTLIEEFPGGMDRLRGDELKRLDQLTSQIGEREKELAIEHGALRQARERLNKSGTVDPHALEALQSELSDRRDQLAELERQMEKQADIRTQNEAALTIAARRLGSARPEVSERLDQEALEELEKLVDRVQVLREQIRNLTAELTRTHVSKSASGRSQADLREARQALLRWLDGARLSPLEGVLWGGLAMAAGIAAWRLLVVQDLPVSPEIFLLVLIAAGVPLTLLGHFFTRFRDLEKARAEFVATDIEAPLGWTESEVEAHIERLELELESATRHEISQARAAEVRTQLNNQRLNLDKARERLHHFAGDLGVSAESRLETGFQLWCRHLHDWQQEDLAVRRATRQIEQLELRYRDLQTETIGLLERHGMAGKDGVGSRDLAGLIHLLHPRMRRNAELHNDIRAHQHRIEELQADITQITKSRDHIFEEAGLKPGDRGTLMRRCEKFEAWRELEQQRRDCSLEVARLEKRLAGEDSLLRQARDQQRDQLEQLHEELAARVAQRDQLNRRISEIHTRHGELIKRRELESLSGAWEEQRQTLDDELEQHLLAAAGQTLVEQVRSSHQADNEPAALARAGHWFDRFTRHRYRLQFENSEFAALETGSKRRRALSELSTGTRVQLLLAVRLAWIERAEEDAVSLPVFMDEVLTTTDPDRYQAVVESVQEIAAGGRQMFYLTAQTDDARAWSEWAGEGPAPRLIDMAEVRRGQIEPLQYAMPVGTPNTRDIPSPSGKDALTWAELAGVDAVDPWRDAGTMHVFHVFHDRLDLIVRLMKLDLARLGRLEAFMASDQSGQFLDAEERELLEHRLAAARLIIEDWQLRHYRPVNEAALHASGLISDNFMPRVVELNRKLGGHPRALIKGLRDGQVARFRSDTTDQLEQWLADEGFLNQETDRQRLSAAELSIRTSLPADRITDLRAWINGAIADPLSGKQEGLRDG